jgi:hypothetical protein
MPPLTDHDFDRLATVAKRRRAELGIALNDANARRGGVSRNTWVRVEKGLPIRETNYVKIDNLLQWAPGSCMAVLNGGDPVLASGAAGASDAQKSTIPADVFDSESRDLVQLALIATAKDATPEEIRAMSERVARDLGKYLRDRGLI